MKLGKIWEGRRRKKGVNEEKRENKEEEKRREGGGKEAPACDWCLLCLTGMSHYRHCLVTLQHSIDVTLGHSIAVAL